MRPMSRIFLFLGTSLLSVLAYSQDSPSLGDAARQARQQKQQQQKDAPAKDAQAKDPQAKAAPEPKTPKVITNDEIPAHSGRLRYSRLRMRLRPFRATSPGLTIQSISPRPIALPTARSGTSANSKNSSRWKS